MAADPQPPRLGGAGMAHTVRWPRLDPDRAAYLLRGAGPRLGSPPDAVRALDGRAGHHGVRERRATGALPAPNPDVRRLLVPGIFRTRRRLGPRLVANAGRAARRRVPHQR